MRTQQMFMEFLKLCIEKPTPCADNGHLFDTDEAIPAAERAWNLPIAKDLCNKCPLMHECLTYALTAHEPYGIWGGKTPEERQKLRSPQSA